MVACTASEKAKWADADGQISKMQMRLVLQTALELLVQYRDDMSELLFHWLATGEKPNRKSRGAKKKHREKWGEKYAQRY